MRPGRTGFRRDQRGGVAVISAVVLAVLLSATAFAVDTGLIFLQSRKLQGIADLAAIAAARDLQRAEAAALATVADNGGASSITASVTTGIYTADAASAAAQRYRSNAGPANAAQVTLRRRVDLIFAPVAFGRQSAEITRKGTAASAQLASLSIGSRLMALHGGVANALLSALTGSQINLSVADYNALVGGEVNLLGYLTALRTEAELEAASFDQVLAADISTGKAFKALSDQLARQGQHQARLAVDKLVAKVGTTTPARLDRLIGLGPYGGQDRSSTRPGAAVFVNAADFVSAVLIAANGERQIQFDLGAGVPGLADTEVWAAFGERPNTSPWLTIASDGSAVIRTAQARLYVKARVSPGGALGATSVQIPLYVELASAQAKLSSIDCAAGGRSASVQVLPSLGHASLSDIAVTDLDDFKHAVDEAPAKLVTAPLIKVTGTARLDAGGATWRTVRFTQAEVDAHTIKTVDTQDVAQALTASLVEDLSLNVQVAGLGLGLGQSALTAAVANALQSAATPLDGLLTGLTGVLGVHLGQADVRVGGLRCQEAVLVG